MILKDPNFRRGRYTTGSVDRLLSAVPRPGLANGRAKK
jgi:hypothetical protein